MVNKNYITTMSHIKLDPTNPTEDSIDIIDIALVLGNCFSVGTPLHVPSTVPVIVPLLATLKPSFK